MQTYTVNVISLSTPLDREFKYKCACGYNPHIKAAVEIDDKVYWHFFCRRCLAVKLEDEPEFMAAWLTNVTITLVEHKDRMLDRLGDLSEIKKQALEEEPMHKIEPGVYMRA